MKCKFITFFRPFYRPLMKWWYKICGWFFFHFCIFPKIHSLLSRDKNVTLFIQAECTIGDSLQLLSLAASFASLFPQKSYLIWIQSKQQRILKYYPQLVPYVTIFNQAKWFLYFSLWDEWWKKKEISCYSDRLISDVVPTSLRLSLKKPYLDFVAFDRLRFPSFWKPILPKVPLPTTPSIRPNGPYILINLESQTIASCKFVTQLQETVSLLKASGFFVFENVHLHNPSLDGTLPVDLPLDNLFSFAKQASGILSIRSGFLDFLISTGTPIVCVEDDIFSFSTIMPLSAWRTDTRILETSLSEYSPDKSLAFFFEKRRPGSSHYS